MIQGKTRSGFCYELDKTVMNNMELVDALADMQDNDALSISKVLTLVLGHQQKRRLYDHVRTPSGQVPVEAVYGELAEIFEAFEQSGKNS